jgi:tripartite-type tricarboxylate transporter receptor subunit TctC
MARPADNSIHEQQRQQLTSAHQGGFMTITTHSARRLALRAALGLLLAVPLLGPAPAQAQAFPSRPIHIVVPFASGGAVDAVARAVGQQLSLQMGQPVIIDNKPGASANLGADFVAKAPADGYTLLMGANGLATNGALFAKMPFDTLRDFVPVARVGYAPLVLVVHPASPAKNLAELIALGKAQPGKLNYGSAGNGSSGHLASELFKTRAGIDVLHVPYKGGAPALTDLLGERLTFMVINPVEAISHIKSQRLRPLAMASARRIPMLPEVPTFGEAGLAGYEASVWWGLVAPAATPKDVVARLSAETLKALADAGVREKLANLGAVVDPADAAEFGRFLKTEVDKWTGVIKAAGIQPD